MSFYIGSDIENNIDERCLIKKNVGDEDINNDGLGTVNDETSEKTKTVGIATTAKASNNNDSLREITNPSDICIKKDKPLDDNYDDFRVNYFSGSTNNNLNNTFKWATEKGVDMSKTAQNIAVNNKLITINELSNDFDEAYYEIKTNIRGISPTREMSPPKSSSVIRSTVINNPYSKYGINV